MRRSWCWWGCRCSSLEREQGLGKRWSLGGRRRAAVKLRYPNGEYTKDAVRKCLEYALEVRRRVKEQLKKIGGMEFYDVHFSYIDLEDMQERLVSVPEQGGGGLIPEGRLQPGVLHTIALGSSEMPGVYRMDSKPWRALAS